MLGIVGAIRSRDLQNQNIHQLRQGAILALSFMGLLHLDQLREES